MASKAKKQKLRHYFYQQSWEEEFFVVPLGDGCKCLVCAHVSVSNRKSSVQKHFLSHHAVLETDFPKGSTARTQEINALKSRLVKNISVDAAQVVNSNSNSTTRLSFKIAYILAKAMRPFEDGAFAKEIMIEMANELIENGEIKNNLLATVQDTPLSNKTITRRVQAISTNIENQLMEDLQDCAWFSLQVYESTDVSDTAQLSVLIRMVFDDCSTMEELLSVIPLNGGSKTGRDVFSALKDTLTQKNVPLEKLVSITTDSAPAMVGRQMGSFGLCKEDPDFPASTLNFHPLIHQQALCVKSIDMTHVMQPIMKIVNSIRARPPQHGLSQALLQEAGEKCNNSTLHTEVRWLIRGKVLERFYEALPEIREFLMSRNEDIQQLQDQSWLMDLAFFVDMMKKINTLNSSIQGRDIPIWTSISYVEGFRDDLTHWIDFFHGNGISPSFENLTKMLGESGIKSEFCGERFARYLEKLAEEFQHRFQEFVVIQKIRNYFFNPLVQQDTQDIAGIITDLFPALNVFTIREEMASLRRDENYRFRFPKCTSVDEFWRMVDQTQYCNLVSLYKRLLSCFASSYLCESMFSSMKHVKSRLRSRLTDNLESLLRISVSSYEPDFQTLVEQARGQASH